MKPKFNLIIAYVALIVVIMGFLGFMAIKKSQETLIKEEIEKVKFIVDSMYTLVDMRQGLLHEQIKNNLNVSLRMLSEYGPLKVDAGERIQAGNFLMPAMYAGEHLLTGDTTFVDEQGQLLKSTSAIFCLDGNEFVLVSTNVLLDSGERAVGTSIGPESPIYRTIIKKEPYYSRAWIVNDWYVTAYKPLLDKEDRVVGMLYNGVPEIDEKLREIFDNLRIGKAGYLYVMNSDARILFYPTGREDLRGEFGYGRKIIGSKEGSVEFIHQGSKKLSTFRYFEPWDWYIVATVRLDDMHSNVQGVVNAAITIIIIALLAAIAMVVNKKLDFPSRKSRS
jgi:methyl-accepting chemotaxis protein